MSRRKWPVIGVVLAVVWLFVRGVELAPAAVAGEALIGLGVGLAIAYGFRRMYLPTVDVARSVRVAPTAVYYVAYFLWELLTANVDVAYRVLAPSMPIEPDVVEIPLRAETDAAITTLANSITLTPGTLTMDHDEETETLYVHGIVGRRREEVVAPIRRWEDLLLVIFEEPADPDEAPPEPPSSRAPMAADPDAGTESGAAVEPGAGADHGPTEANGRGRPTDRDPGDSDTPDGAAGDRDTPDGAADDEPGGGPGGE